MKLVFQFFNPPRPPFIPRLRSGQEKGGGGGILFLLVCFLFLSSCGSEGFQFDVTIPTQTAPFVSRVVPANGVAGDTVTVFGFGFSAIAATNIISFGSVSASATGYSLLASPAAGELESLEVKVPAGATAGSATVFVTVFDNTSNASVSFTVN